MNHETKPEILQKAKNIQLVVLDVDGVMTDGSVFFTALGDELKAFSILDGQGIKALLKHDIGVAIITGRCSPLTAKRANDLGIKHLLQGREDKKIALTELSTQLSIPFEQIAYVGDDLPDLSAIVASGLGITVPNCHPFIKQHADYCTQISGGKGAVREVSDLILTAKDLLSSHHKSFLE